MVILVSKSAAMHIFAISVLALCSPSPLVLSHPLTEVQSGALSSSSAVKVSVNGVRNQTGYWTTEVILGHENSGSSSSWAVDVEADTNCVEAKATSTIKLTFIAPPAARRIPGYQLIPGLSYYKFHAKAEQWPRAKQVCEEEGAHLVIVNSEEESKAMVKLYSQNTNITGASNKELTWVGARESEETNGTYFTIFGESLASTGFLRWNSGQPDNGNTLGDYIYLHSPSGGLGDYRVSDAPILAFICEQDC